MAKKNDPPASTAKTTTAAELITEIKSDPAPEIKSNLDPAPEPAPPDPAPAPDPAPDAPVEPAPVVNNPPPDAPAMPVTAAQLIAGDIPSPKLPPPPTDKKRGKGRPPGAKNKTKDGETSESSLVIARGTPTEGAEGTEARAPEKAPVNHRQLAEITFDLSTNSAAALLGPEWRANDATEREGMIIPLEMYLKTKNMDDIPPGAILCFALATYIAPRLRAPATSSKLKLAWHWVVAKWNRKKFKPVIVPATGG